MWSLPALVPCRWNWHAEFPVWYPLGYCLSISKKKCSQPRGINLNLFICLNSKTPKLLLSLSFSLCASNVIFSIFGLLLLMQFLCVSICGHRFAGFFPSLHNNKEIHCMSWHYNLLNLLWIFWFVRSTVFLSDQGTLTGLHEKCCIFFPSLLWCYCLVSFSTIVPFYIPTKPLLRKTMQKEKTLCKHWIK